VTSKYAAGIAGDIAGLPEDVRKIADTGLTGALQVGSRLGGEQGASLIDAGRQAFVDGMGTAAVVGSLVVLCAAIVSRLLLPRGGDAFDNAPTDLDTADRSAILDSDAV
jgi:hypothetical protein